MRFAAQGERDDDAPRNGVVIGLTALIGGAWLWRSRVTAPAPIVAEAPRPGYRALAFTLPALDGGTVSLTQFRGRAVILNFWATWCPPCRAEMPALQRVYARYADRGLVVLGLNATASDDPAAVRAFQQRYGLTFPILLDESGTVNRTYGVAALPTTFFIGPDGQIREIVVGGPIREAALEARIRTLLPAGGP
ncbi:MAG: TlpA family protein disulfide reductase [Thermoflexus sp.]